MEKNQQKKDYYSAFEAIFGTKVLEDFKRYQTFNHCQSSSITSACFQTKLKNYIHRATNLTNFYKNEHYIYSRFVLITLEKIYGDNQVNLSEVDESSLPLWEIEHIIPQKNNTTNFNLNMLGNLTLIPKSINSSHYYNTTDLSEKQKYIIQQNPDIADLFINQIFKEKDFYKDGEALLASRDSDLKKRLKSYQLKFKIRILE